MKSSVAIKPIKILFLLMTLIFVSCGEKGSENSGKSGLFSKKLVDIPKLEQQIVQRFDSLKTSTFFVWDNDTQDLSIPFKQVYSAGKSIWLFEKGLTKEGIDLLSSLPDIKYDGLDPDKYRLKELLQLRDSIQDRNNINEFTAFSFETKMTAVFLKLSKDMLLGGSLNSNKEIKNPNDSLINEAEILLLALKNQDISKAIEMMRPQHNWYQKFRSEYKRLCEQKVRGGWQPVISARDSFSVGDSSQSITLLRKRLNAEIGTPADTVSALWNIDVFESLKKFQFANQLKQTGKLDTATIKKLNLDIDFKLETLALNMERMRWLKHDFRQPFIWVDIPKMEMDYVEKDSTQFNMRVVIGRPSRPTPALDAKIQNVVFSPPWIVPPTIMREEVVPGIARRGGSYLARRGLKAYDRRGRVVSASAINAGNFRQFSIGQAPGYSSSLGEIKFNMPNPWSIYMHDTPHREDFVKSYRAYSSGCVRVHKPKEFAVFLLRDPVTYNLAKVDSICKLRKTIFVPVERNIEVHFVYLTAALDSIGNIMYLKDIYGWDKRL